MQSKYPGKVILFGEYTVILGSDALAFPLKEYFGNWDRSEQGLQSWDGLGEYFEFLKTLSNEVHLDLERMASDLTEGCFFQSNIPIGSGLGSSGSLTAGIFDRYHIGPTFTKLSDLKRAFSKMEGFFHGQSSGIDPLISYLNKTLYFSNQGEIEILHSSPEIPSSDISVFLVKTPFKRKTEFHVNAFKERIKSEEYLNAMEVQVKPLVEDLISSWISGEGANFFNKTRTLSKYQWDYFNPMILDGLKDFWKEGIESENYHLKLCGAGGGGCYICFTKKEYVKELKQKTPFPLLSLEI